MKQKSILPHSTLPTAIIAAATISDEKTQECRKSAGRKKDICRRKVGGSWDALG